jgi:hypothetical protein
VGSKKDWSKVDWGKASLEDSWSLMSENQAMRSIWGVVLLAHQWFEIRVRVDDAVGLSLNYCIWRSGSREFSGGVLVWLKSRLRELGYCAGRGLQSDLREYESVKHKAIPSRSRIRSYIGGADLKSRILYCHICRLSFRSEAAYDLHAKEKHPVESSRRLK